MGGGGAERRKEDERKGVFARIKLNRNDTPVEHSFAHTRASTTCITYEVPCRRVLCFVPHKFVARDFVPITNFVQVNCDGFSTLIN